jgi:hypothetical protein
MPAKKKPENKTKRYYHADGYTYDEYSLGSQKRNITDFDRLEKYEKQSRMGAVGPERTQDFSKRLMERKNFIEKNPNLRVLDTSRNKARGTQSSTTRRIIK